MFDPIWKLTIGLVTGILFGVLLQKGRVAKYEVILGQFLLKDWTVVRIMGTAIVVGAIGIYASCQPKLSHCISNHWPGGESFWAVCVLALEWLFSDTAPARESRPVAKVEKTPSQVPWECCLVRASMSSLIRLSRRSSSGSAMKGRSHSRSIPTKSLAVDYWFDGGSLGGNHPLQEVLSVSDSF